jgi:hypothetical protein
MSKKDVWTCDRCGVEEISPVKPMAWVALGLTVQRPGYPEGEYDDSLHLCQLCADSLGPNIVKALRQLLREDWQAQQEGRVERA